MTDYAALRALAEKATPGPWEVDYNAPFSEDLNGIFAEDSKRYVVFFSEHDQPEAADACYIAAVGPDVILALLDELDGYAKFTRQKGKEFGRLERERDAEKARADHLEAAIRDIAAEQSDYSIPHDEALSNIGTILSAALEQNTQPAERQENRS